MANLHVVHVDLEATPRRVPPPLSAQPAKSILKKRYADPSPSVSPSPQAPSGDTPQAPTTKPSLVWDEHNLEETSRERGTRMKIDEVETPYAWPGDYSIDPSDSEQSDDDDAENDDDDIKGEEIKESKESNESKVIARAPTHGGGVEVDELAARLTSVKRKQDAGVDLASHPDHIQLQKEDFKRRRKLHYDEGKVWKQQQRTTGSLRK